MKKISKKDLELKQEKISDLTSNNTDESPNGGLNTFGTVCICATVDNCPATQKCGKTTTGGYCCADTGSNCMEPYTVGHVCASHGCLTNTCEVATRDFNCIQETETCLITDFCNKNDDQS